MPEVNLINFVRQQQTQPDRLRLRLRLRLGLRFELLLQWFWFKPGEGQRAATRSSDEASQTGSARIEAVLYRLIGAAGASSGGRCCCYLRLNGIRQIMAKSVRWCTLNCAVEWVKPQLKPEHRNSHFDCCASCSWSMATTVCIAKQRELLLRKWIMHIIIDQPVPTAEDKPARWSILFWLQPVQ